MFKKTLTLGLVATVVAGLSFMTAQPSEAHGNCQQGWGGNQGYNNQLYNSAAGYPLNNGYNSGFYGNQFSGNGNSRQALKRERKLEKQLLRQQQMAAGYGLNGAGYNNTSLISNLGNQFGIGGGGCQNANSAYNQGFKAGVNSVYNNGYNGYNNAYYGSNTLGRLTGLNGLGGLNGLNNLGYGYGGSGVSSVLGRVLNRL